MACLAILFAFVGNRGLIRNSIHYARYVPPVIPPGLKLEFDLDSSGPSVAQLFWDTGAGFNETESSRQNLEPHQAQQTLRFPLPGRPVKNLRFDPRDNAGGMEIRGIRVVDAGQRTRAVLPPDSLEAGHDIARLETGQNGITIQTASGSQDPITYFTPAALAVVNRTLADQGKP